MIGAGPVSQKILIVAGEASGDQHAAQLVAAIQKEAPGAGFAGVGGEALAGQGVRILWPAAELAVVGLLEVAARLPAVFKALRAIARFLKRERPSLVILVDFPDFNFWVARLARYYRVPVMYYISPQVWAWRTYRVRTLARLVDRMAVIFPFEADFYQERGVPVTYVGHPFMETLPAAPPRSLFLTQQGLDPERLTVALLPGSRPGEIERHLPKMLQGAELISQAVPEVQFLLPLASTAPVGLVEEMVENFRWNQGRAADAAVGLPLPGSAAPPLTLTLSPPGGRGDKRPEVLENESDSARAAASPASPAAPLIKIISGRSYEALTAAHLAVVASGTATVEAALAATPTIIVYRLSPLTFAVGRKLIRVAHVGMANLLAGERLFPELIQDDFTPERLACEALSLLADPSRLAAIRRGLARIVQRLGGPGASRRAAQVALEIIRVR